jgi:hypothetical protein
VSDPIWLHESFVWLRAAYLKAHTECIANNGQWSTSSFARLGISPLQ